MIRFLAGLLPPWGWALLLAIALATAGVWHVREKRDARAEGRAEVQARWDAAAAEAQRLASIDLARRDDLARRQSAGHESARASIDRTLTETRHALDTALQRPITCPVGTKVGDLVLPADVLDSVRAVAASGDGARADQPAAPEPGRALP